MIRLIIVALLLSSQVQAQSLVIVFLHHRTDKAELPEAQVKKIMEGHMANIQKMAKEGKLLVAGPFDGGGGIFIFNTASQDSVRAWIKADPGIQANRWRVELQPYQVNYGQPRTVGEPIQMTSYQFVRFKAYIAKFNINDVPHLIKQHEDFIASLRQTSNVVADAVFNDTDDGILIMRGDLEASLFDADPAVHAGLLEVEIKKWYTARGAFGEN